MADDDAILVNFLKNLVQSSEEGNKSRTPPTLSLISKGPIEFDYQLSILFRIYCGIGTHIRILTS